MNDQQRAAMIRPRGKSVFPQMVAAYKAMQMALEALEDSRNLVAEYLNRSETNEKAITALREALSAESTETCGASAQPQDHSEQHLNMVQGEPVAWMRENEDCTDCFVWERDEEHTIPLYTTPPSVEAAIEATKERCAKVCEKIGKTIEDDRPNKDLGDAAFDCAAAIREMK